MMYISEKHDRSPVGFIDAVLNGLASDGGLYVPRRMPEVVVDYQPCYSAFAAQLLQYFCGPDIDSDQLEAICSRAFNFPLALRPVTESMSLLELFHGPTAAFKDFGARFLAEVLQAIPATKQRLVMVATSGDTGSAVASAFYHMANTRVCVLYPYNRVSARQAHQLSCWGGNITTLAVKGSFDDCQHLVKSILQMPKIQDQYDLTTANSISIGRLLPQVAYYAYVSLQYAQKNSGKLSFVVPSGNLGNATAAFWAREIGMPIDQIVLAQNDNKSVVDYLQSGVMPNNKAVNTIANAMDVGRPSNFMRLCYLYPDLENFKQQVSAYHVDEAEIKESIGHAYKNHRIALCPHTAVAYAVWRQLDAKPWVIAATANPCKFETVVEPLIETELALPAQMLRQLERPMQQHIIAPTVEEVLGFIN